MAKDEFSKANQAKASAIFTLVRKQVLNRTPETNAIQIIAKDLAELKGGSDSVTKGNLTKAVNKVKKQGNTAIADYRGDVIAAIEDPKVKDQIRKLPYPKL